MIARIEAGITEVEGKMGRRVSVLSIMLLLAACASTPDRREKADADETGMRGIAFGMSQEAVLAQLQSNDTIIDVSTDRIISQGKWDGDASIRRKTFNFQAHKLQCIRYEYVSGATATPNITPTFCK